MPNNSGLFSGTGEFPQTTGYTTAPKNNNRLPLAADLAVDFTPVVGDIKAGIETAGYLKKGEYGSAALSAVGMLPFIPPLAGILRGPTKNLFHGTSKPIDKVSDWSYNDMNIYGQGFYTTDSMTTAKGYTKKGRGQLAGQGDVYEPTLYRIEQPKEINLYDLEKPMSDKVRNTIRSQLPEELADIVDEPSMTSLRQVYDEIRDVSEQIDYSTDTVQEVFFDIRDSLQKLGYRGFEHTGGIITGNSPHKVRIYWEPTKDIKYQELKPEVINTSTSRIID
jgi:hypothetical protein